MDFSQGREHDAQDFLISMLNLISAELQTSETKLLGSKFQYIDELQCNTCHYCTENPHDIDPVRVLLPGCDGMDPTIVAMEVEVEEGVERSCKENNPVILLGESNNCEGTVATKRTKTTHQGKYFIVYVARFRSTFHDKTFIGQKNEVSIKVPLETQVSKSGYQLYAILVTATVQLMHLTSHRIILVLPLLVAITLLMLKLVINGSMSMIPVSSPNWVALMPSASMPACCFMFKKVLLSS